MVALQEAWIAANFSLLWTGLGQLYIGQKWVGGLLVFAQTVLVGLIGWSILGANGHPLLGLGLLLPGLMMYIVSLFEAYRALSQKSILTIFQPEPTPNPWLAFFLSQVLPGLGQIYLKQRLSGTLLLLMFGLLLVFSRWQSSLAGVNAMLWASACGIAYFQGFTHSTQRSPRLLLVLLLAITLTRTGLLYGSVWLQSSFQIFQVPSSSMAPTLQPGDRILVYKAPNYQPQNGEVIVFRHPLAETQFIVKRVLATPQQQLDVFQGKVYRDRQLLQEAYVPEPPDYEWRSGVVPEASYVVLGDNRNNSYDSHLWGWLSAEKIVGHAYKVIWPAHRVRAL